MAELARIESQRVIEFPNSHQSTGQVTLSIEQLNALLEEARHPKKHSHKKMQTDSQYKTNGVLKARPADPIRTKEDFQKIVSYLGSHGREKSRARNQTMFILGCSVALRCGDLLKLSTADVFNKDGTVKVHIDMIDQKTHKRSTCKIPEMSVKALVNYRDTMNFEISRDVPLFPSDDLSEPITVKAVWRILNNAGKACGLDAKISTHTMRKTYAMAALSAAEQDGTAGQTLEMLQMKLNHSDARITMTYCKAAQDKIDRMSDSVSNWFEGE